MAIISSRWQALLTAATFTFSLSLIYVLFFTDSHISVAIDRLPGLGKLRQFKDKLEFSTLEYEPVDEHPISKLISIADRRWNEYKVNRSLTFKETVSKYRIKYGRNPPPHFATWYKYARDRDVYNIDDFDQIMDDLRPFWAVSPRVIRILAAHMWEEGADAIAGVHIRGREIVANHNAHWRAETMMTLIKSFVRYLPDMDIAINTLDQPRVAVPWEDLQTLLAQEASTRQVVPGALDEFSSQMTGFLDLRLESGKYNDTMEDPKWFDAPGKPYMNIAKSACPPESHAATNKGLEAAETKWKTSLGGFVTNFNLSSDLCTIGPELQDKHGFLFTASSIKATRRLVPVFSECKVNVNNDILYPANMYWKHDRRYEYDGSYDVEWEEKEDTMIWRGVTSGGVQVADNWHKLHRQRLIRMMNATFMGAKEVEILTERAGNISEYVNFSTYPPSDLLSCKYYDDVISFSPQIEFGKQFRYKYLIDVDGHSFSGRWRAFLQSKGLCVKATIFREWHDSRLFAWKHFVPLDNRFTEIYSVLTYFLGVGDPTERDSKTAFVPRHDAEAKRLALQGRDWANKVLRREDIEVYMFRLLLEYGRIIDDNRDNIGYSGDGSELDERD